MVRAHSACRRRLGRRGDNGFSLVETTVAIAIAMVVFMAIAGVLIATTKASLLARENQQSIDAASEAMERVRALQFAAVANSPTESLSGDPYLVPAGTDYTLDPDGSGGTLSAELLVRAAGAGIVRQRTVARNTTDFDVFTYVTRPPTDPSVASAVYRRVTVVVRWTTGTKTRERRTSTVVTSTRRGLPLPKFEFGTAREVTVNQTAVLSLPFTVTNRGAPDRWNLSYTSSPTVTWSFAWHLDSNGNGVFDTGEPALTDSADDNDTVVDTGLMFTDQVLNGVLVATVPLTAAPTTTAAPYLFTLTAVSAAQPSVAGASKSFVDRVNVSALPCVGCGIATYYLQNENNAANGDTNQRATMVLTPTQPLASATTLWNFDRNIDARPGRQLAPGGLGAADSTASRSMVWDVSLSPGATFGPTSGTNFITVSLYARKLTSSSSGTVTFHAYVNRQTAANTTVNAAAGSVTLAGAVLSVGWTNVVIAIPITSSTAFTVGNNRRLELRLQTETPTGDIVEIAYDSATYPSSIQLPKR